MAYHVSCLGSFSREVERFADLDGFVPEPGDDPEAFLYPDRDFRDRNDWESWCLTAMILTDNAEIALERWRG